MSDEVQDGVGFAAIAAQRHLGRMPWWRKCPASLVQRARDMLAARAQTPRQIYDDLNLQRHLPFSTFRRWCTEVRKEWRYHREAGLGARGSGIRRRDADAPYPDPGPRTPDPESCALPGCSPSLPCGPPSSEQVDRAIAGCVEAIGEALLAGRIGKLNVAAALGNLKELKTLSLEEQANRRANEIHELKLADLRSKVKAAVEDKTAGGTKNLTREDVYDLVDQVMRGAA